MILRENNKDLITKAKAVKQMQVDVGKKTGFIEVRRARVAFRRARNNLKKEYMEFEEVIDSFNKEENMQNVNPLHYIAFLTIGIIGFIFSFLIIMHT